MKTIKIIEIFAIAFSIVLIFFSATHAASVVHSVQKRLVELGYDPGPVDGIMGKKTKNALKGFQKDNNLTPTGTLNKETMEKLGLKIQKEKVATTCKDCLKEITTCDVYGKPKTIVLYNVNGEKVAMRKLVFKGSFIVYEDLIDVSTGETIKTWTYNARSERNEPYEFLCLNEKGNIVKDKHGKPILIEPFRASQKESSIIRYSDFNPFIKAGQDTTIYPCTNCKKETDGLATFVW